MLIARYQMYGAVYWHHTFRCIQAMFAHCAAATFGNGKDGQERLRVLGILPDDLEELFFARVVCGKQWRVVAESLFRGRNPGPQGFKRAIEEIAPASILRERALEFVWRFADSNVRELLRRLSIRDLYKRIFDVRFGELGEKLEYAEIKPEFAPVERIGKAKAIQKNLIDQIDSVMRQRGPKASYSEKAARAQIQRLSDTESPLIVIDFPIRGLPEEDNLPVEIGDPFRKYFAIQQERADTNVFLVVRQLQMRMAAIRVFAASELHELVIRYLRIDHVRASVRDAVKQVKV